MRSTIPLHRYLAENFEYFDKVRRIETSFVPPENPAKDQRILCPSNRDFFVGVHLWSIMLEPDGPKDRKSVV